MIIINLAFSEKFHGQFRLARMTLSIKFEKKVIRELEISKFLRHHHRP